MRIIQNSKGVALTVVVIVLIMVALLTGYVASLGYNQRRVTDAASGRRAKIFYRAKAGAVDAAWRIRVNYFPTQIPPNSFLTDAWDPPAYTLDVDGDGTADTSVDIGPVTNPATRQRAVLSTGLDV